MAERRFVKRFLAEAVPAADWSLRRARRHVPRSAAAPFTPDFHREATRRARRATTTLHAYVISKPYAYISLPRALPFHEFNVPKAHFRRLALPTRLLHS